MEARERKSELGFKSSDFEFKWEESWDCILAHSMR